MKEVAVHTAQLLLGCLLTSRYVPNHLGQLSLASLRAK